MPDDGVLVVVMDKGRPGDPGESGDPGGADVAVLFAENVPALAALTPVNGQSIEMQGWGQAGDGGGGPLIYRDSGAPPADARQGVTWYPGAAPGSWYARRQQNPVNVAWAGASPQATPTDNANRIEQALAAAKLHAGVGRGAALVALPGEYQFDRPLTLPNGVDFDQQAGTLVYTGADLTGAVVTLGEPGSSNEGTFYRNLAVRVDTVHRYPSASLDSFAALRVAQATECEIEIRDLSFANIALQLLPYPGDNPLRWNNLHGGALENSKIGIDLRGNVGAGVVQNQFYGFSHVNGPSMDPYGSARGVRFSAEPGGQALQDGNSFYSPALQPRNLPLPYQWTSGGSGVNGEERYWYDGREYLVEGGDGQTFGTLPPVHTSGTVSDGLVNLTYVGEYLRPPIYYDGAGSAATFTAVRADGYYGSLVTIRNSDGVTGNDNFFDFGYTSDADNDHPRWIDEYGDAASTWANPLNNRIEKADYNEHEVSGSLSSVHERTIFGGQGGLMKDVAVHDPRFANFQEQFSPNQWRLCSDGLWVGEHNAGGFDEHLVALVPIYQCHRFKVSLSGEPDEPGGIHQLAITAVDANYRNLPPDPATLLTDFTAAENLAFATRETVNNTKTVNVVIPCDSPCRYISVGWRGRGAKFQGISVVGVRDSDNWQFAADFINPQGNPHSIRATYQEPVAGHFPFRNEPIADVTAGGGVGLTGYSVVSEGWLIDKSWSTGIEVKENELRDISTGQIWAAETGGTTGPNEPDPSGVPVGGSASDGAINWILLSGAPAALRTELALQVNVPELYGAQGDGNTDDSAAFQQACDQGGFITSFRADALYVVQGVTINEDNTTIALNGATIVTDGPNPRTDPIFIQQAENFQISNTRVDGQKQLFGFITAESSRCLVSNTGQNGLTLTGNQIANMHATTVFAEDISNVTIRDNRFENCNLTPIYLSSNLALVSDVIITGNVIDGITGDPNFTYEGFGIYIEGANRTLVAGNFILDTNEAPIRLRPGVGQSQDVKIIDNIIDASLFGSGISLQTDIDGFKVSRNTLRGMRDGLRMDNPSVNVQITDNDFTLSGVGNGVGIRIFQGITDAIIGRNSIKEFDSTGLLIRPQTTNDAIRVTIDDNVFTSQTGERCIDLWCDVRDIQCVVRNNVMNDIQSSAVGNGVVYIHSDGGNGRMINFEFSGNTINVDDPTHRAVHVTDDNIFRDQSVFRANRIQGGVQLTPAPINVGLLQCEWFLDNIYDAAASIVVPNIGTAPPTFPPRRIGEQYLDTTNRVLYMGMGVAGFADFVPLN